MAPLWDFGLFPNTPGKIIPPVIQSIAIKTTSVCSAISHTPNSSATALPIRSVIVKILYFINFHLHFFLKKSTKKEAAGVNRSHLNTLSRFYHISMLLAFNANFFPFLPYFTPRCYHPLISYLLCKSLSY